jgi:hypothetical protein
LDKYEKTAPKRSRRDKNLSITLKTPEALEAHLDESEKSFKLLGPSMECSPVGSKLA